MLLSIILIALSISADAFSYALIFGTQKLSSLELIKLPLIVGVFHFVFPLIGNYLSLSIINTIRFELKLMFSLILIILGLNMQKQIKEINKNKIFLFSIAVSIDSLLVGTGLKVLKYHPLIICSIFLLFSSTLTYLGLKLSQYLLYKTGHYITTLGGVILIIIAFFLLLF